MEEIGMYDAKTRFSEIVEAIRDGGKEFMITKSGTPVAILTQVERRFSPTSAGAVLKRIQKRREELSAYGSFLSDGESVNEFARDGLKW